jgi:hypothetical protein
MIQNSKFAPSVSTSNIKLFLKIVLYNESLQFLKWGDEYDPLGVKVKF